MVSQLVDLENEFRRRARYEDKLGDVQQLIIGYYVLLAGFRPKEAGRQKDFDGDLSRVLAIIKKIGTDTGKPPTVPAVTSQTGDANPEAYTMNINFPGRGDAGITVLRDYYQFSYTEAIRAEREAYFYDVLTKLLPDLAEVRAVASKWGLYGPETKVARTEMLNSIDRVRKAISDRTSLIAQQAAKDEAPAAAAEPAQE